MLFMKPRPYVLVIQRFFLTFFVYNNDLSRYAVTAHSFKFSHQLCLCSIFLCLHFKLPSGRLIFQVSLWAFFSSWPGPLQVTQARPATRPQFYDLGASSVGPRAGDLTSLTRNETRRLVTVAGRAARRHRHGQVMS